MGNKVFDAKIIKTFLGREEHGIFTFYLMLERSDFGTVATYGGFALSGRSKDGTIGYSEKGLEVIFLLLDVCEVQSWEDLIGVHVKLVVDSRGMIEMLGNQSCTKWISLRQLFSDTDDE